MVVQATCLGLLQHFWASVHSLHLEEAPSLQLGEKVASISHGSSPASAQLGEDEFLDENW